ncbi:hypothetical protein EI94DRAFT_77125 [Lactarius quietus]|nr:hypothetical protein EI94DRAFT_77125 [Lactarius quietus]
MRLSLVLFLFLRRSSTATRHPCQKHRRVLPATRGCFDGVACTDRQRCPSNTFGDSSNLRLGLLEREEWRKRDPSPRVPHMELPSIKGRCLALALTGEAKGPHRSGHSPVSLENPLRCLLWGAQDLSFGPSARLPPALLPTPLHPLACVDGVQLQVVECALLGECGPWNYRKHIIEIWRTPERSDILTYSSFRHSLGHSTVREILIDPCGIIRTSLQPGAVSRRRLGKWRKRNLQQSTKKTYSNNILAHSITGKTIPKRYNCSKLFKQV